MKNNYTFKVDVKAIEITPELEEHFQLFDKKVRTIAPISELQGILPDKVMKQFSSDKKVLIVCDYETGILDVDILEESKY